MKLLQQMVQRRHLLAWLGTWAVIMVMAWGAIAILLNPNLGVRPAPPQLAQQSGIKHTRTQQTQQPTRPTAPIPIASAKTRSQTAPSRFRQSSHENMALWSLGIVAIACIYGSVILTQHIKGVKRRG